MKKYSNELKIDMLFILLLVITLPYDLIVNSGEKLIRIVLIFLSIIGARLVYAKSFLKGYIIAYYMILGFIFISMYLGNIWSFYSILYYDKFLHLSSGFLTSIIGYILFLELFNEKVRKGIKPNVSAIFVSIFSIAAAALWEIWEFTTDLLFGLDSQAGGLIDTMLDIISGTLVGIITALLIYRHYKGKNIKVIEKFISNKIGNR